MMALGSVVAEVGLSRIRWCAAATQTGGRCTHMFQVMKGYIYNFSTEVMFLNVLLFPCFSELNGTLSGFSRRIIRKIIRKI